MVLKPTLLGGIRKTLCRAQEARAHGIQSIISSSFESGIGIATLAHLTAASGAGVSAGLDTLKWFSRDLLKEPCTVRRGIMSLSGGGIAECDIRTEYLAEVSILP